MSFDGMTPWRLKSSAVATHLLPSWTWQALAGTPNGNQLKVLVQVQQNAYDMLELTCWPTFCGRHIHLHFFNGNLFVLSFKNWFILFISPPSQLLLPEQMQAEFPCANAFNQWFWKKAIQAAVSMKTEHWSRETNYHWRVQAASNEYGSMMHFVDLKKKE